MREWWHIKTAEKNCCLHLMEQANDKEFYSLINLHLGCKSCLILKELQELQVALKISFAAMVMFCSSL